MGLCAGVGHLEHIQWSQETKKLTERLSESVRWEDALAGNSTSEKIPTTTLLMGSCPLGEAVGYRDVTLSLAQSLPHLTEMYHCSGILTHCTGRGRRWRVVGTTEEWRSLPPASWNGHLFQPPVSGQGDLSVCHYHYALIPRAKSSKLWEKLRSLKVD